MAYRALLISNWEYADPDQGYAPLKGPRNDLERMAAALTHEEFGLFDVGGVDARANVKAWDMRGAFHDFLKGAKRSDNLLIYFSGHGDRLVEADGRLALCGVDTRSQALGSTSFDTAELRQWIDKLNRSRSTVVILDCCYAGAMKGVVTQANIAESLGSGTMVLAAGGSEPAADGAEDEPSPFTAALADILIDPELHGDAQGRVTIDAVYDRLTSRDPPLLPLPTRNVRGQGTFPLAKRATATQSTRPDLIGFHRPDFEPVELRFDGALVTTDSDVPGASLELQAFHDYRMSAVRRMSQLTDAVLRVGDYEGDEWAQRAIRRAWNCVGVNLLETGVPSEVRTRIKERAGSGAPPLKLRLAFADNAKAKRLEGYPWEYMYRDDDPGEDRDRAEPQPMALSADLLVERVVRADRPLPDERTSSNKYTLGIVSAVPGKCGDSIGRIAEGLASLAPDEVQVVFDQRGAAADWGSFVDALEQRPNILVMSAPLRRGPGGVEIGFWPYPDKDADWQSADDLIDQIHRAELSFTAIILVTFAAKPGQDTIRATSELGRRLARAGVGPVVFVCHSPQYAAHVADHGQDSFPVLFVDVLTRGERVDHAVYYAKTRVATRGNQDSRRAFGVPGYYVIESAEGNVPEKRSSGLTSPGLSQSAAAPSSQPKSSS